MPSLGFATAPMLIVKNDLLKPLKALSAFDHKGAPYVAVQLVEGHSPMFMRSNNDGIIQSKDFGAYPTTFVSLGHLTNVLKNCPEDSIELSTNERGIMRMYGTSGVNENSESQIHTVSDKQAGIKTHDIGARILTLDPNTFAGLDIDKYTFATEPVISSGKIMISTNKGAVVLWSNELLGSQPIKLSPRESFLRMVCGQEVSELVLTANGYWGATIGDLVTYTKGHILGRQLFDSYNQPGVEAAQLPAERLLTCLKAAVNLLDEGERIDIDPKLGVIAKGTFGDNRNSLGETGEWNRFAMQQKTAKVVIDTLSQASDDYVKLEQTSTGSGPTSTMRLIRGEFAVNFRSF
jgi:hypothetical protein